MTMRRPRVAPTLAALLLAAMSLLGATTGPASAQESEVTLTLTRQTPWVSDEEPTVSLEVQARNAGATDLDDLALRVTMFGPAFSRSDVGQALLGSPPDTSIVIGKDLPLEGTLDAGAQRSLTAQTSLAAAGIDTTQSYVYPLRVELVSGGTVRASLHSTLVVVVPNRGAQLPLRTQVTVPLVTPLLRGLDGVYQDDGLERAVAGDGRLTTTIAALRKALATDRRPLEVDLVVAPLLVLQLEDMTDGYAIVGDDGRVRRVAEGTAGAAEAAATLAALRSLAGSDGVAVTALPFAGPTLPSLRGALAPDLEIQFEVGRGAVDRLLGVSSSRTVVVPRRSAVDQGSLDRVVGDGADVLVLTPLAVPPAPQPNDLSPPPVVRLPAGRVGVAAVVATQSLQDLVTADSARSDPVLAAQSAFAMLATIWLEQPGIGPRGASILLPETAPGRLIAALSSRIAGAPFLDALTASDLVETIGAPETTSRFVALDDRGFDAGYVDLIRASRRRIGAYRSMLVDPSPLPDQLSDRVLLSEAAEFLDDPASGIGLLDSIQRRLDAEFAKVRPGVTPTVTLTSRNGQIPFTVANAGTEPVDVMVGLESPQLERTGDEPRRLTLGPGETRDVVWNVRLQTTGQFPVRIVVRAPIGRPISEATVVVRSTAYSRIALFITIGAAVVLLALWGRRLVRRATRS